MAEVCTVLVSESELLEKVSPTSNNEQHDLGVLSAELLNEIQHFDKQRQKRLSGKFMFHIDVHHDDEVAPSNQASDNNDVVAPVATESASQPRYSAKFLHEIQQFERNKQPEPPEDLKLTTIQESALTDHQLLNVDVAPPATISTNNIGTAVSDHPPTSTSPDWMCAICLDSLPKKNPNSISCVTCQFCIPCLAEYVKIQIEEKTPHMTSHWTIRCPCLMEGCELSTADVERSINGEVDEPKRDLLLAKFHRFALDLEVQHDPRKVFCPQTNCSAVVTIPNKHNFFSLNRAKCQHCKHSFCIKCNHSHNRFLGCDSASEYQFRLWRLSTRQGCKKCPGCKIYIEKNDGCSHMTCRACGTHFCWHCLRRNHGNSIYCKVLSALASEEWGESTATRTLTKTLAIPGGLVAGGLALVAVGVAAGLAVAGGAVALCVSPAVLGFRHYRDRRSAAQAAEHLQQLRQQHIFQHGIVFVLPPHMLYSYSSMVDTLLDNMAGVTIPAQTPYRDTDSFSPQPYRVAYTDFVLYFSPTPSAVPGFEADDFPFMDASDNASEDNISYINRYGVRVDGVRPILTTRRAYVQLSSTFMNGISALGSASEVQSGQQLNDALQYFFEQASHRTLE